jgi:protein-tyrosine phosphatase
MILDCNEIIPDRMWVGSYIRLEDVSLLRQMGITSILSLQTDQDFAQYNVPIKKLLKSYAQADIEFRRVPTPDFDRQSLLFHLPEAVEELEKALAPRWAKVYVHCTAGINRGPTLAAAYLIKARGLSAQQAYDHIHARRHCGPYLSTLEEYERNLKNGEPS